MLLKMIWRWYGNSVDYNVDKRTQESNGILVDFKLEDMCSHINVVRKLFNCLIIFFFIALHLYLTSVVVITFCLKGMII